MSIHIVKDGAIKELGNLIIGQNEIYTANLVWYGKVDGTDKLLSDAFDDSKIVGVVIKPGYYYLRLYGSNSKQLSNTSVAKDTALSYLNFSVSGKNIDIAAKAGYSVVSMYLYVWIRTSDGQLHRIAEPRLNQLVKDKMSWDYSYYDVTQTAGTGVLYNIFEFRSDTTTYKRSIDGNTSLQNTWLSGHLSPLFSPTSNYGDLRLSSGGTGSSIHRTTYKLSDPKWNGRSIPLTIEL